MTETYHIAAVQMDIKLGQIEHNLARMTDFFHQAVAQQAQLVIFPECAITGYGFDSRAEVLEHAQLVTSNSPLIKYWTELCQSHHNYVIFGTLELDADKLFNTAVCIGPQGLIGRYRKIHLPYIGADRFTDYGQEPFKVYDLAGLKVGLNICYDSSFPESARTMALLGADLIVLPTNWPPGAECQAHYSINTRAMENTVYYAAVNRVGLENGCNFIGGSSICDPLGNTIASADNQSEQILYATIHPAEARNKLRIRIPGISAVSRLGDRRPEFYTELISLSTISSSRDMMETP